MYSQMLRIEIQYQYSKVLKSLGCWFFDKATDVMTKFQMISHELGAGYIKFLTIKFLTYLSNSKIHDLIA